MMMKEPVDHIIRPRLPWRLETEPAITECGYDASKVKALTPEQFLARLKELGRQRAAMLTCMTCSDTAQRWSHWQDDPRKALEREIVWECGGGYYSRKDRGERLKFELEAIAALVAAHREEFTAHISDGEQRRAWLEKKAQMVKPKSVTPPRGRGLL
jgi:hypothetical protein